MLLKQYYLGCLAHASYLIGDEASGVAVVVDPRRDVELYLDEAAAHKMTVQHGVEFVNTVDVFEGASAEANAQAYEAMGATIRARKP